MRDSSWWMNIAIFGTINFKLGADYEIFAKIWYFNKAFR